MNIKLEKKHYDLIVAFASGVAVGVIATRALLEKKLREDMYLNITSIENAYNSAIALRDARDTLHVLADQQDFDDIADHDVNVMADHFANNRDNSVDDDGVVTKVDLKGDHEVPDYLGSVNVTKAENEATKNAYHKAVEAMETPVETFVDGGVNDYGVSYIEEEDFLDSDDGRFKGHIEIILGGNEPTFMMDGEEIDDWDERVGDSILVDMFNRCPPGTSDALYVRNHRTDEDYEVVRVTP